MNALETGFNNKLLIINFTIPLTDRLIKSLFLHSRYYISTSTCNNVNVHFMYLYIQRDQF